MLCNKCGQEVSENDLFCGNCGAKIERTEETVEKVNSYDDVEKNSNADNVVEKSTEEIFNPYNYNDDTASQNVNSDSQNEQANTATKTGENISENLDENNNVKDTYNVGGNININQNSNVVSSKQANVKTFKINKKALIAVVAIVLVVVVGVSAFNIIWNKLPVEIDLSDYVVSEVINDKKRNEFYEQYGYEINDDEYGYEDSDDEYSGENEIDSYFTNYGIGAGLNVYGYNEYATISEYELENIISWDSLKEDINEKLAKKKKVLGRHLTFSDFFTYDSLSFTADKYDKITNDDVINVEISSFENSFEGISLKIKGCTQSFTISDLVSVQAFDPFDYVSLVTYGANGYANASCRVDGELNEKIEGLDDFRVTYYDDKTIAIEKDGYVVAKIDFYFDEDTKYNDTIRNGDSVVMYCSTSGDDLTEQYSIYVARNYKEYTIDDLGEYITKSTTISQKDLEKFKSYSETVIDERFGDADNYSKFSFNSAYVVDLKDKTSGSSFRNDLCMIYSYKYKSWNNKKETRYLYVIYSDLIVSSDGSIAFAPEDYYNSSDYSYGSVDEILSHKYDEDYNVSKLK